MKQITKRAGMIPFYVNSSGVIEMLFMKPSDPEYGGKEFQIAKGRWDEGDTNSHDVAMREANEELGLKPENVRYISYVGKFLGHTDIYICAIKKKDDFANFTYETGETKWMTMDEFRKHGRPLHLNVVERAFKTIINSLG